MAHKKTAKRRRLRRKKPTIIPFEQRNFPAEIIKRLEAIVNISGRRPGEVFSDWLLVTEATLKAMPDQIKTVGATGRFAEDTPEIADTFARVQVHYGPKWLGQDRAGRVWQYFAEAFALLLEATAPGLWGEPNSLSIAGISGPDIIGHIFQTWANPPSGKKWHAQILSPWPVARLISELSLGLDGERQIHDRLKQALCHPDNILGQAILLAGLTLPDDQPEAARDYFFKRVLPAALPFYTQPLLVNDPAVGTGILLLGGASVLPAYACHYGLVQFSGQDIDPVMTCAASINTMVYGLNTYSLKLEVAVAEALAARKQNPAAQPLAVPQAPVQIIQDVYRNGTPRPLPSGGGRPSFEQMFRAAAERQPAAVPSTVNLEKPIFPT